MCRVHVVRDLGTLIRSLVNLETFYFAKPTIRVGAILMRAAVEAVSFVEHAGARAGKRARKHILCYSTEPMRTATHRVRKSYDGKSVVWAARIARRGRLISA